MNSRGEPDSHKERRVFVTNGAADTLAAWLRVRGDVAGPLFLPVRKGGHVARGRLDPQTVYDFLAARAEQAGIERPSPRDLRRSCISDLLDRGNDLAVVKRLAGHASPVTTARYDRRPEGAARRAAETLTVPFVPAR